MSRGAGVSARLNPLAAQCIESLAFRFAEGDWESHWQALARLRFRGAIVGPQGSGKTTLLEELAEQLPRRGMGFRCARALRGRGTRRADLAAWVDALHKEDVLLLDSAEQLRGGDWRWLVEHTAAKRLGLVVTVHRRCGLATWVRCKPSRRLLHSLLCELGFDPQCNAQLFAQASIAYRRQRGNLREVLRTLYDQIAAGGLADHVHVA